MEYTQIKDIAALSSTSGKMYENPNGKKTFIRLLWLHNTSSATHNVAINKFPAGNSSTASNRIFEEDLEAKGTRILDVPAPGIMLTDEGDSIYASGDSVNIYIVGGVE